MILDNFQKEQKKLFIDLEKNLEIVDFSKYENKVNYKEAATNPVQRWFSYREGYSTNLVQDFIKENKIHGRIFDPFCGSGSTLLAARYSGNESFGLDINPYSTLIATVSNEYYSIKDKKFLTDWVEKFKYSSFQKSKREVKYDLLQKVFNAEILESLYSIRDSIESVDNQKIKSLLFATWLSILESVSNIKKEGNGIKYLFTKRTKNGYVNLDKIKWEEEYFPDNKYQYVKNKLLEKLNFISNDLNNNYGLVKKKPQVLNGSCLDIDLNEFGITELTYYSPPYCNSFDYFEIHKIELWMGEFITSKQDHLKLKKNGFRSNISSLGNKKVDYTNENIEKLESMLLERKLWDKRIPMVMKGYFDDTYKILSKIYSNTDENGYLVIVVGNSAYSGCIIPTDILIADIGRRIGFNLMNLGKVRHLTTSSQQIKYLNPLKEYLRESILIFKK